MATEAPTADPNSGTTIPPQPGSKASQAELESLAPGRVQVIRRNGKVTHFDANKIMVAMTKAFLAVEGGSAAASSRIHDSVRRLTDQVVAALTRRLPGGGTVHVKRRHECVDNLTTRLREEAADLGHADGHGPIPSAAGLIKGSWASVHDGVL